MNDTITAISTALGIGAISIIRISGDEAITIANQIFKGTNLTKVNTHTIHYGYIVDNDETIDEVLVTIMKSPKTFTTEDVVEINCHGGIATTNKVLELVLSHGARLAEPGEFTKRAFLNGRIDLVKADGIMNLIASQSDQARKISMNQLKGATTKEITNLRDSLIAIISQIEVNIDYPEYEDIEQLTNAHIKPDIESFQHQLTQIITDAELGHYIIEGLKVGIVGKPNVGKSSLLNALIEEDKAIVTDIEGTTRDIVEGTINLHGLPLKLVDTAGIRHTNNLVEKIGVNKSLDIINSSDLIIYMLNNNTNFDEEDQALLAKIKDKKHLIVVNKSDLPSKLHIPYPHLNISLKDQTGLEELKSAITDLFNLNKLPTQDMTYLSNARSISLLKEAMTHITTALSNIEDNYPIDIIEIELKNAWEKLGEITGETYTDELINELFSRFCLGK